MLVQRGRYNILTSLLGSANLLGNWECRGGNCELFQTDPRDDRSSEWIYENTFSLCPLAFPGWTRPFDSIWKRSSQTVQEMRKLCIPRWLDPVEATTQISHDGRDHLWIGRWQTTWPGQFIPPGFLDTNGRRPGRSHFKSFKTCLYSNTTWAHIRALQSCFGHPLGGNTLCPPVLLIGQVGPPGHRHRWLQRLIWKHWEYVVLGKAIPMNFNPTVVYQLHILFVGAGPYIFCSPNYGFKMFQPCFDTYNKLQGNALKISGGENRALWSVPYFKGRLWVPGNSICSIDFYGFLCCLLTSREFNRHP